MNPEHITIELQGRSAACAAVCKAGLARCLELILERFGLHAAGLDLLLTDDRSITELNRRFLGLAGPTNVLSFPDAEARSKDHLGQICLSMDTLYREARLYGQHPAEHLIRLLSHGILHLAGYVHGPRMQALTDQGLQVFLEQPDRHLLLGQVH